MMPQHTCDTMPGGVEVVWDWMRNQWDLYDARYDIRYDVPQISDRSSNVIERCPYCGETLEGPETAK